MKDERFLSAEKIYNLLDNLEKLFVENKFNNVEVLSFATGLCVRLIVMETFNEYNKKSKKEELIKYANKLHETFNRNIKSSLNSAFNCDFKDFEDLFGTTYELTKQDIINNGAN